MGIKSKLTVAALFVAVIASLTLWAHVERSKRKAITEQYKQSQAMLEESENARELERAIQSSVALIDQIQTEKLRDAQAEIDDLRGRVASGSVRLHVGAECETQVSETTGDTGVDTPARPRLTERAREGYYRLREGIERVRGQLAACQDILLEIKKSPHKEG